MNRRQFLLGASTAAMVAALPRVQVLRPYGDSLEGWFKKDQWYHLAIDGPRTYVDGVLVDDSFNLSDFTRGVEYIDTIRANGLGIYKYVMWLCRRYEYGLDDEDLEWGPR